jgi:hypothetical protein
MMMRRMTCPEREEATFVIYDNCCIDDRLGLGHPESQRTSHRLSGNLCATHRVVSVLEKIFVGFSIQWSMMKLDLIKQSLSLSSKYLKGNVF